MVFRTHGFSGNKFKIRKTSMNLESTEIQEPKVNCEYILTHPTFSVYTIVERTAVTGKSHIFFCDCHLLCLPFSDKRSANFLNQTQSSTLNSFNEFIKQNPFGRYGGIY